VSTHSSVSSLLHGVINALRRSSRAVSDGLDDNQFPNYRQKCNLDEFVSQISPGNLIYFPRSQLMKHFVFVLEESSNIYSRRYRHRALNKIVIFSKLRITVSGTAVFCRSLSARQRCSKQSVQQQQQFPPCSPLDNSSTNTTWCLFVRPSPNYTRRHPAVDEVWR